MTYDIPALSTSARSADDAARALISTAEALNPQDSCLRVTADLPVYLALSVHACGIASCDDTDAVSIIGNNWEIEFVWRP